MGAVVEQAAGCLFAHLQHGPCALSSLLVLKVMDRAPIRDEECRNTLRTAHRRIEAFAVGRLAPFAPLFKQERYTCARALIAKRPRPLGRDTSIARGGRFRHQRWIQSIDGNMPCSHSGLIQEGCSVTGPSSGSIERNRTRAGTPSSFGMSRSASAWLTTVAPSQTFCGMRGACRHSRSNRRAAVSSSIGSTLPIRFVSNSQSRFGVCSIRSNRSARHPGSMALSNTSASDAQNTRRRRPC